MNPLASIFLFCTVLTNLSQVAQQLREARYGFHTDCSAVITTICQTEGRSITFGLKDPTGEVSGSLFATNSPPQDFSPGDLVNVKGLISSGDPHGDPFLTLSKITLISHGTAPQPVEISENDLQNDSFQWKFVSITGTILDTFRDEIDTDIYFLVLHCTREVIYACTVTNSDLSDYLLHIRGTKVKIRGICYPSNQFSLRRQSGYSVAFSTTNDIQILHRPTDFFDEPELDPRGIVSPHQVHLLGRRKITGLVRAIWQSNHVLLKTQHGDTIINLSEGQPPPTNGQHIEVVGLTETDLYNISLSHAMWRPASNTEVPADPSPVTRQIKEIFTDANGRKVIDPRFHGKVLAVTGTVKNISHDKKLILEDAGFSLTIDCSSTPAALENLAVGSIVTAAGICIMETDIWTPYSTFPHIKSVTIVLRNDNDLTVLKAPSWWTSDRLLVVLAILFSLVVGIVIWNRFLSRLVERRSRQLAKERMARDRADVRADERTRLSVELHDTIAQNLSGIALQLDAVQLAAEDEPEILFDSIRTAQQSLSSCRQNLRYCLWDLRSRAFEEKSLSDALTRTLKPHQGRTTISIDCPIGTRGMSDNAIHAVLCIIRELVINAIRHGKASRISISGREEHDTINFSITDNGSGFDPNTAPGITEGHFGLQGVKERVHQLKGILKISSHLGTGTSVAIHGLLKNI